MNLTITDIKWKIERLEKLLESKKAEYQIFGKTPEDTVTDLKIKQEIDNLKEELDKLNNSN